MSHYYKRGLTVLGGPVTVLGASYTDKGTVVAVQFALLSLPAADTDPDFKALRAALATQADGYGAYGPKTKAAVAKFNKLYGGDPTGGSSITDGTLAALHISPGGDTAPAPAQVAIAQQASSQASSASTPSQVQSAATQVDIAAQNSSPKAQQAAKEAKQAALAARTPAEVQAAAEKVQEAAALVEGGGFGGIVAYFKSVPTWQIILGVAGAAAAGYAIYRLAGRGAERRRAQTSSRVAEWSWGGAPGEAEAARKRSAERAAAWFPTSTASKA